MQASMRANNIFLSNQPPFLSFRVAQLAEGERATEEKKEKVFGCAKRKKNDETTHLVASLVARFARYLKMTTYTFTSNFQCLLHSTFKFL